MELLLFIAGSIGLTHVLVDGAIFAWLRNWLQNPTLGKLNFIANTWYPWIVLPAQWFVSKASEMIHCHMCAGCWVGFFISWAVFSDITGLQILTGGFASSFLSMFAAILFNYLESQTIIKLPLETK